MFINRLRKVAALGVALCIVGTLVLAAPVTALAAHYGFSPFGIDVADINDEE